jgi:hypothetical protein
LKEPYVVSRKRGLIRRQGADGSAVPAVETGFDVYVAIFLDFKK